MCTCAWPQQAEVVCASSDASGLADDGKLCHGQNEQACSHHRGCHDLKELVRHACAQTPELVTNELAGLFSCKYLAL